MGSVCPSALPSHNPPMKGTTSNVHSKKISVEEHEIDDEQSSSQSSRPVPVEVELNEDIVSKLNQENSALRQRISDLEATVLRLSPQKNRDSIDEVLVLSKRLYIFIPNRNK